MDELEHNGERSRRRAFLTGAAALALVALGIGASFAAEPVRVVATFSILADLVQAVGGPLVSVESLVGPDIDMHTFQPSPADSRKLLGAKLVVTNGLGLEGWFDRLAKASGYRGSRVVAAAGVRPLAGEAPGHDDGGHGHGRDDPHAWQDPRNVKVYVANIRDALVTADPANRDGYQRNAEDYLRRLDDLDRDIRTMFAAIPKAQRRVITTHEAFDYYGAAYDIEFRAAQGVSEDAEPSARDVARLIQQIKREKVSAIFIENVSGQRLLDRIAQETGARIGGMLYSDALSRPDGRAPTYLEMMRYNAATIAGALRPTGG